MYKDATVCRFRCTICSFRCHVAQGATRIKSLSYILIDKKRVLKVFETLDYYFLLSYTVKQRYTVIAGFYLQ